MRENTLQILTQLAHSDYHMHSSYSQDAQGNVDEFVRAAIAQKLEKICFTTHIDLDPRRASQDMFMRINGKLVVEDDEAVEVYNADIERAKQKFAGDITVLRGYEFSYECHYDDIVRSFIARHKPDFTIGSVHVIEGFDVTAHKHIDWTARSFTPEDFVQQYYATVEDIARSELFSVIGHIDGYKKYLAAFWGKSRLEQIEAKVFPKTAEFLARCGAKYEINAAGLRKAVLEPYPAANVLCMLENAGCEIGSIGSDAHSPSQVGAFLCEALYYVRYWCENS